MKIFSTNTPLHRLAWSPSSTEKFLQDPLTYAWESVHDFQQKGQRADALWGQLWHLFRQRLDELVRTGNLSPSNIRSLQDEIYDLAEDKGLQEAYSPKSQGVARTIATLMSAMETFTSDIYLKLMDEYLPIDHSLGDASEVGFVYKPNWPLYKGEPYHIVGYLDNVFTYKERPELWFREIKTRVSPTKKLPTSDEYDFLANELVADRVQFRTYALIGERRCTELGLQFGGILLETIHINSAGEISVTVNPMPVMERFPPHLLDTWENNLEFWLTRIAPIFAESGAFDKRTLLDSPIFNPLGISRFGGKEKSGYNWATYANLAPFDRELYLREMGR